MANIMSTWFCNNASVHTCVESYALLTHPPDFPEPPLNIYCLKTRKNGFVERNLIPTDAYFGKLENNYYFEVL